MILVGPMLAAFAAPTGAQPAFSPMAAPEVLSAGRAEGVSVGTRFFTRRVEAPSAPELRARGTQFLRTSGWLRAVDVDEHATLAVIEHACADVRRGDQLAPLQ